MAFVSGNIKAKRNTLIYIGMIYVMVLWTLEFLIHNISNRIITQITLYALRSYGSVQCKKSIANIITITRPESDWKFVTYFGYKNEENKIFLTNHNLRSS